jgi:predicted metallopeptidase
VTPTLRTLRTNVSRAIRLLIRDIARRIPELSHVRADRVLVVAGEARRASRATIRPMRVADTGKLRSRTGTRRKPRVTFRGHPILYVMTMRPLFFRNSTPEARVESVIHELFHVSPKFDGTLASDRRHAVLGRAPFEKALRPLVKGYLADCQESLLARLSVNGDVLMRQWLERPPNTYRAGSRQRRTYSEAQTFLGPVRMITRHVRH